jgi:uncharacterized protein (TIGR01777 family)
MDTPCTRLVLPGGRGFLGGLLADWFSARGWRVVILTRRPVPDANGIRYVYWNGESLGDWTRELDGADAVVNLAGRSVNCRYHSRTRRAILNSRLNSTRVLADAIRASDAPPRVWLNSSTATIYQHSLDREMDESGEIGAMPAAKDAFSVEVAERWERAFDEAVAPRTRKVLLRTAMVLADVPGTVYCVLRRLVRIGLGGPMGSGRQYVSWIHHADFCRAIEWLIDRDEFSGGVNLASPTPVTNSELMHVLRQSFGVPFGLPATEWMLELGAWLLRTETELVIKSRRVVPGRLLASGFEFEYPRIEAAIRDLTCVREVQTIS